MAEEKPIYEIAKNEREVIKLKKSEFKGKEYIDFRTYIKQPNGEDIPTKKGISLSMDLLEEFKKAVAKL